MPESQSRPQRTVLVLGGGIHGAAVARELVLNGVSVTLVDTGDLATGATSKSSRLIHGGLRYLEYGDIHLVRESLAERERLLKLAPQFVSPLRLYVPTAHRWSGLLRSAIGFLKIARTRLGRRLLSRAERRAPRGFWTVRIGLWMYDLFSWGTVLPKSHGERVQAGRGPKVDTRRYRWQCAYSDAQMRFPERCVIALLTDARQAAAERGVELRVIPYAELNWQGSSIHVSQKGTLQCAIRPDIVINTSGAWGDLTLRQIDAGTTPLFGGTKGSHLVTRHPELMSRLGDQGIYAETGDRRLAFVLPFGDAVLVGTTDEPWSGPPDQAVATEEEIEYLIKIVETVFGLKLTRDDVESHYSGVRPLTRSDDTNVSAISRDHAIAEHVLHGVRILTLVGGKLTTFRSVAEQLVDNVLSKFDLPRVESTRDRLIPGAEGYPRDDDAKMVLWQQWADQFQTTIDEVKTLWPLYGMRTAKLLADVASQPVQPITGSPLTMRTVKWIIENEWVSSLEDLVERRILLLFDKGLTMTTLLDLEQCFSSVSSPESEIIMGWSVMVRNRLHSHYGRRVAD